MLTFDTPHGKGQVETEWSELTPQQFVKVVTLINKLSNSPKPDIQLFRIEMLGVLTGYKRSRVSNSEKAAQINENLLWLSEQITFAIKPHYPDTSFFDALSPEVCALISERFPSEIYDPEIQKQLLPLSALIRPRIIINFNIGKMLLTEFEHDGLLYSSPRFDVSDLEIDTTLLAGEYMDAVEYFDTWGETRNPDMIRKAALSLYSPKKPYHPAQKIEDPQVSDAFAFQMVYIQQTFATDTVYGIMFSTGETMTSEKIYLGSDEAISHLVTEGIGSHEEIRRLPLLTFFNYQLILLKKAVASLRAEKKSNIEIAKLMKMDIHKIVKL